MLGGGVSEDTLQNAVGIKFSGWREWADEKEMDKIYRQSSYAVDIPADTDLAEFFKTAEHNTIYRVQPNTDVKNTCEPNNGHTFYALEGTFIAGYTVGGDKYLCNFVNRIFTKWEKVAVVEGAPEIELLNGWEKHTEGVRIAKNGSYVSINFILMKGIRTNGTTLFVLSENYRPKIASVSLPVVNFDEGVNGYIAVKTNGNVDIYGLADTRGNIFCAGGLSI